MNNFSTISSLPCNKTAAYIVKIVKSVCRDRFKRLNREGRELARSADWDALASMEDPDSSLDALASRMHAVDTLEAIEGLSRREKELIRMRHIDGMDYGDMAQALGMSEGSIRTALSRALTRLREMAGSMGEDGII